MFARRASPEEITRRTASIQDSIGRISAAAGSYAQVSQDQVGKKTEQWETAAAQNTLLAEIRTLVREVQGPIGTVWEGFESAARTTAIRSLLEIGVFETLPADGTPMTADELVHKLQVPIEKALLIRFMRNVTHNGPLAEVGEETYAHTPFSHIFNVPEMNALFKHFYDENWPSQGFMAKFFHERGWNVPRDGKDCPFTYAHRAAPGDDMWAHIARDPERQAMFDKAMTVQTLIGTWSAGIYPFAERLQEGGPTDDETVLVVDVGGGKGHLAREIKKLCGDAKGKVVLQDRDAAIQDAYQTEGVENTVHDFFAPQPIKGARIYYLRRCLHDWSDSVCVTILKNLAGAMDETSRLVISEQIVPSVGADSDCAIADLAMMTFTGMERTKKQWIKLLEQSGLKLVKFHTPPGTTFGVIEASVAAA